MYGYAYKPTFSPSSMVVVFNVHVSLTSDMHFDETPINQLQQFPRRLLRPPNSSGNVNSTWCHLHFYQNPMDEQPAWKLSLRNREMWNLTLTTHEFCFFCFYPDQSQPNQNYNTLQIHDGNLIGNRQFHYNFKDPPNQSTICHSILIDNKPTWRVKFLSWINEQYYICSHTIIPSLQRHVRICIEFRQSQMIIQHPTVYILK